MDDDAPFRGSAAVRAGRVTRARLRGPAYRRLGTDTYVDARVAADDLLPIRAALVHAGPTGVATGWSACRVLGLDVVPARVPVELATGGHRVRPSAGEVVRRQRIPPGETLVFDGMRATTPIRTAFDVAGRSDVVDAVVAADALGRLGGFDGAALERFARRRPGLRGVRRVLEVAALMDPAAESPMETRTRLVIVRAGLPAPTLQHVVRDDRGRFLARVDMAWPDHRVALEYDGHDHASDDRRGRDVDRIDALRRAGWTVIVVTLRQYRMRGWIERRVAEALSVPSGRSW